MIVLNIPKVDIPTSLGWVHESTDWQVATNPTFNDDNIVAKSEKDTKHLTSISFDIDIPSSNRLYARARVRCNKGVFRWSTIGVIEIDESIDVVVDIPIPSKIAKPVIHLDYPNNNFPSTMFKINTDPMSSSNNSKHVETYYFITDLDGKAYYYVATSDELNSKLVNEIKLPENKTYLLSVAFRSSSNDVSPIATEIIHVKYIPDIVLKSNTENIDATKDFPVAIQPVNNFKSMNVKIYGSGIDIVKLIYNTTQQSMSVAVPSSVFKDITSTNILISIQVQYKNNSVSGFKYFPATIKPPQELDAVSCDT